MTPAELDATFVFADIAGFTALTEAHGDEAAADLVVDFTARVGEIAPAFDGELVKTAGDAVMLRTAHAADGVGLALAIVHELMRDHGAPTVRAGIHSGPATARAGDWFGATVNVAARIAAQAAGGEVLLSERTRAEAGELAGVAFLPRGVQRLHNVREPLALFAAARLEPGERSRLALDPVCRMAVDPDRAAGRLTHAGRTFHFCSLECAGAFARDPDAYARED